MSFGDFRSPDEVARAFQIRYQLAPFLQVTPRQVDPAFAEDLADTLQHIRIRSEAGVCEFIVAPVLKQVWRPFRESLLLWSHVPFGTAEPLQGTPDFFFSRRTSLGLVPDHPCVLVVEAKRDDFDAGWGQCLAAMVAAQRAQRLARRGVYGCVTNGQGWQFGKLFDEEFTQELRSFVLSNLPELFGVWHHVFTLAREQALAPAA